MPTFIYLSHNALGQQFGLLSAANSATVGQALLIFAQLVHESVVSCQVLWGMISLQWHSWVAYLCSTVSHPPPG